MVTSDLLLCPSIYQSFLSVVQREPALALPTAGDGNCLLPPRGGDVTKLYVLRIRVFPQRNLRSPTLAQLALCRMLPISSWIFSPVKSPTLLCHLLGPEGNQYLFTWPGSRKRKRRYITSLKVQEDREASVSFPGCLSEELQNRQLKSGKSYWKFQNRAVWCQQCIQSQRVIILCFCLQILPEQVGGGSCLL